MSQIPVWTQEPTAAAIANHSSSASTASQDYKSDDGPEDGLREPQQSVPVQTVTPVPQWMPDAHIILNARGQFNIRDQKPHIQVMLRTSISLALHHIAFEDAYPDMNHTRRTVADILYMAANQTPGCERMRARLAQDAQCVRSLSSVVSPMFYHTSAHSNISIPLAALCEDQQGTCSSQGCRSTPCRKHIPTGDRLQRGED